MKTKLQYIIIFSIVILIIIYFLGLFEAINQRIYDNYLLLSSQKSLSSDIVIIKIDDKTINHFGQWPFNRSIYAEGIEKIIKANPAVIGITLEFNTRKDTPGDSRLYKALKAFKKVVILSGLKISSKGNFKTFTPGNNIFPDIPQGHACILYTEKNLVRTFPANILNNHFVFEVLQFYLEKPEYKKLLRLTESNNAILIDYKRVKDNYLSYSFIDLLNDKVPPEKLKNKIVLMGVTEKSYTTVYTTPLTEISSSSTLVELMAQVIDSFIIFRNLQQSPDWLTILIAILTSAVFFYFSKGIRVIYQGLCFVTLMILFIGIDYLLFKYFAYWLPPTFELFLLLCTFGFSIYFTTSQIDEKLVGTIKKLETSKNVPLLEIPDELTSRIDFITALIEIINNDRQMIKAIIDGINNGILVIDDQGVIVWANELSMKTFNTSLVIEENISTLIPTINLSKVLSYIEQNKYFKTEISHNNMDFLCIITSIQSKKKQFVVIFNDITDLKNIDRLKTDMMRMVSHELRSPLTVIQISSDNISELVNDPLAREFNSKITNASAFMLETINNFLNINKLESNMMDINIKQTDLASLIEEVIDLHNPIALQKEISIVFNKPVLPSVKLDKKLITIVLNNLISNAIKYSDNDNKIDIIANLEDHMVTVSVVDYGIGIPQEDQDKIFTKFFRSINNEEREIQGTGLGLSIVQKVIALHQGNITFKSEENKGSTFSFSLPIDETDT